MLTKTICACLVSEMFYKTNNCRFKTKFSIKHARVLNASTEHRNGKCQRTVSRPPPTGGGGEEGLRRRSCAKKRANFDWRLRRAISDAFYQRRLLAVCFSLGAVRLLPHSAIPPCLAFFSTRPTPFAFALTERSSQWPLEKKPAASRLYQCSLSDYLNWKHSP